MNKPILIALVALVSGCTRSFNIDLYNGDQYGYSYAPWQSEQAEDMAARAKYYEWGARTQYGKDTWHRIEIVMYQGDRYGQTNVIKRAKYWIRGEKE